MNYLIGPYLAQVPFKLCLGTEKQASKAEADSPLVNAAQLLRVLGRDQCGNTKPYCGKIEREKNSPVGGGA